MDTNQLVLSYIGVRRAIGYSGLILPILLGPIGYFVFGVEIQDNMSSYYHTPLRDIFVGTMCAIGIFLLCYRGSHWVENWTANVGCVTALGVALFPLDANSDPLHQRSIVGYLHTFSGGLFFLTLAFYSLYHFPRSTNKTSELEQHPWERNFIYRLSGLLILVSMSVMGGYLYFLPSTWKQILNQYNLLFWMEWIAIWAFAAAWLTKGRTLLADIAVDILAVQREAITEHLKNLR